MEICDKAVERAIYADRQQDGRDICGDWDVTVEIAKYGDWGQNSKVTHIVYMETRR